MKETRLRNPNCYECGVALSQKTAIKRPKTLGGESLIWCGPCHKKQFAVKKKLIQREVPKLWLQD